MASNRKRIVIILAIILGIPMIPVIGVVGENLYSLAKYPGMSASFGDKQRIVVGEPAGLPPDHPARDRIETDLERDSRPAGWWPKEGRLLHLDLDADGTTDTVAIDGGVELRLSSRWSQPSWNCSDLTAAGVADIDGDGADDLWWADPGDRYWAVVYAGAANGRQRVHTLSLPTYSVAGMTFFDVDGDGRLDVVYASNMWEEESAGKERFWVKLSKEPAGTSTSP